MLETSRKALPPAAGRFNGIVSREIHAFVTGVPFIRDRDMRLKPARYLFGNYDIANRIN